MGTQAMLTSFFGSKGSRISVDSSSPGDVVFGPYGTEPGDLEILSQSWVDKLLSVAAAGTQSFNSILQNMRGKGELYESPPNANKAAQQSMVMTGGSVLFWLILTVLGFVALMFVGRK